MVLSADVLITKTFYHVAEKQRWVPRDLFRFRRIEVRPNAAGQTREEYIETLKSRFDRNLEGSWKIKLHKFGPYMTIWCSRKQDLVRVGLLI